MGRDLAQRRASPCGNVGPVLCDSILLVLGSGVPAVFALTASLIGQVTNVSYVISGPLLKKIKLLTSHRSNIQHHIPED